MRRIGIFIKTCHEKENNGVIMVSRYGSINKSVLPRQGTKMGNQDGEHIQGTKTGNIYREPRRGTKTGNQERSENSPKMTKKNLQIQKNKLANSKKKLTNSKK